jgi:hypothetical protein
MVKGKSTKRSSIDAGTVTAAPSQRGIEHLSEANEEELWVIADLSELRKPNAQEMPDMMEVLALDSGSVPGYRTLNVLGLVPSRRGVLYHRLFSSQEENFLSESLEIQTALQTVKQALKECNQQPAVTWIMDTGFDNVAVRCTIWEQEQHVVCRLKQKKRLIEHPDERGQWVEGDIQRAQQQLRLLATARRYWRSSSRSTPTAKIAT